MVEYQAEVGLEGQEATVPTIPIFLQSQHFYVEWLGRATLELGIRGCRCRYCFYLDEVENRGIIGIEACGLTSL